MCETGRRHFHSARSGISGLLVLCWLLLGIPAGGAAEVTLAWDPNVEPDLSGYRLHYGTSSGVYTESSDVGNETIALVAELAGATTYYFAVTAYNESGLESDYSNEVAYTTAVESTESNTPPVAGSASFATDEETAVLLELTAMDPDGDPLIYELLTSPSGGTLSGTFPDLTYTPDSGFVGSDSFSFRVFDGGLYSEDAAVLIEVIAVIGEPGVEPVVGAPVTLAWDANTEPDIAGYKVYFGVESGVYTESLDVGNTTTATIDSLIEGTTFFFAVTAYNEAGLESDYSNEVVYGVPVSNKPPFSEGLSLALAEDEPASFTLPAGDPDGDALSYAIVVEPAHGLLSGTAPDLVYTPFQDFFGRDEFTFSVDDGEYTSSSATVLIEVSPLNDPPVVSDQALGVSEDASVEVTLAGADPEGDALTFVVTSAPLHGSVTGSGPVFVYSPEADYSGSDSFQYLVTDGTLESAVGTVSISVDPVNDLPVVDTASLETPEDTAVGITLAGADADGDALEFEVTTEPSHGTLSGTAPDLIYTPDENYAGEDGFAYRALDGTGGSEPATISITVAAVNDAPSAVAESLATDEDVAAVFSLAGSDPEGDELIYTIVTAPSHGDLSGTPPELTYAPSQDFNGQDELTFTVSDGELESEPVVIGITVAPVNDLPVAASNSFQTPEDAAASIRLEATDVDGDVLEYAVIDPPSSGTLSGSAPDLVYTPEKDFFGTDSFTFAAGDGAGNSEPATISITVVGVNDAPVASAASMTTNEDVALMITLTGSDSDGDSLTYSVVGQPSHGQLSGTPPELVYTPETDFSGADELAFEVTDGQAASETAVIALTVLPINDAPVASDLHVDVVEDEPAGFTIAGTDADSDALSYRLVDFPEHGGISGEAPDLVYQPSVDFVGRDSLTFSVSDGGLDSAVAVVTFEVAPINDPPVVQDASVETEEDTPVSLELSASDSDGDPLEFEIVEAPLRGRLYLDGVVGAASAGEPSKTVGRNSIIQDDGFRLIYEPDPDFDGDDHFVFRALDGNEVSRNAMVSISVMPVNDPPEPSPDHVELYAGAVHRVSTAVLLANDSDSDGDELTIVSARSASDPDRELLIENGDLVYECGEGGCPDDAIVYVVTDGLEQAEGTLQLTFVSRDLTAELAADGAMTVRFTVKPGDGYDLLRSVDLKTWVPVASGIAETDSVEHLVNTREGDTAGWFRLVIDSPDS